VFKVNELRAEVVRGGMSIDEFCVKIGMKRRTFARRMQDGNFGLDELHQIKLVLNLSAERMAEIFFA
jgi:hypothetical protein